MGDEQKQLQIKDLPPDITEDQLRTVLSNKKRRGGGPVEHIDLDRDDHSALVTFRENEAVNIIFGRGNHINFEGHYATLYRVDGAMAMSSSRKQERLNKPKVNHMDANKHRDRSDSRTKNTNKQSLSESYNSTEDIPGIRSHSLRRVHEQTDEESSSELEAAASSRRSALYRVNYNEHVAVKDNFVSESESSQSESEEESNTFAQTDDMSSDCQLTLAERVKRTVKFKITDVTKSKDFYLLYLEDMQYREGDLIESSILMDATRKHLFVTFKDPGDVKAMWNRKHDERLITEVAHASENDFNWHTNLVAVYGYSFESTDDKTKFQRVVSKRLKLDVVEILQYNESRSLIVKLNQDQSQQANLAKMIWKCSFEFAGVQLIASPVEKANTILTTGLSSKTEDKTLELYLRNKRSGGSSEILVPPIKRLNPQDAIATFINLEAVQKILSKKKHELDGKKIKVDYFHQCLTPEFYEEHFCMTKSQKKRCQNPNSQNESYYSSDSGESEFSENMTLKKKEKNQPKQMKREFFNKDEKRKILQNKKESYNKKLYSTSEEDEKEQFSKERRLIKKKNSSSEGRDEAELKVKERCLKAKEVKKANKTFERKKETQSSRTKSVKEEKKLQTKKFQMKEQHSSTEEDNETKLKKKCDNYTSEEEDTEEEREEEKKTNKKIIERTDKCSKSEDKGNKIKQKSRMKKCQIVDRNINSEEEEDSKSNSHSKVKPGFQKQEINTKTLDESKTKMKQKLKNPVRAEAIQQYVQLKKQ